MLPWDVLFTTVRDEHRGVLVPEDGDVHGITTRALRRRAVADGWEQPYDHTWLLPGVELTAEVRALAAARHVGGRVLVSGWSAAGLMGLVDPPDRPHLLLPHDRRTPGGMEGVLISRSRNIAVADATTLDRIPCSTLPRTALTLAAVGTDHARLRDLLIDGVQRRHTTLRQVVALLERTRGATGRPLLDRIVRELVRDQVDSGLELDMRRFCPRRWAIAAGPFPVPCRDGGVVHGDIVCPSFHHVLECDGAGAHMDRRGFETDRRRWGQLQRAGLTITWVTRKRLDTDLAGIVEEVDEAMSRFDPERPALAPAHDCRLVCGRV